MDTQLLPALQGSLSANPAQRTQSEAVLEQLKGLDGYCTSLLLIASNPDLDLSVRQNAAICLKNAVKRRWRATPSKDAGKLPAVHQADKDNIKSQLHGLTIRSPPLVQKQLLEVVRHVADAEYPQAWPSLLPDALANLSSSDLDSMYGSLLVLRKVASGLEFASEHSSALQEYSASVLPVLLRLLQRLLSEEGRPNELALLLRCIVKIVWSCMYMNVPQAMASDPVASRQWLQAILMLLSMPVVGESQPADPNQEALKPWWKLRKWVLRVSHRLFSRYGDPRLVKISSCQDFASIFKQEFSLLYLQAVMQLVTAIGKGMWCSKQVNMYIFSYLVEAVKQQSTSSYLEPYLLDIILHVALPLGSFTDELREEWEDDPMEVIRKNSTSAWSMAEIDLHDPRDSIVTFVLEVMKRKQLRDKLLDPVMEHIVGIAAAYVSALESSAGDVESILAYKMEGATLMIGMLLETVLNKVPKYRGALEAMAQRYLVPLFGSKEPFLRAKACWLAGKYAEVVEFKQPDGSSFKGKGELFDRLFGLVLKCMQDADLPVQVEAVNSFRDFVEALSEADRLGEKLQPLLKDLLRHLFQMAGMVEAMDVIMSVDTIVERVGEGIQPFAVECCSELISVYAKVVSDGDKGEDEEVFFDTAFNILNPIIKLLDACSELPDTLRQLEDVLVPMLNDMLNRNPEDILEQVCEILSYLTYFQTPISGRLWSFWDRLEACLKTNWGVDFCDNAIVPLDNFISRGQDVFCTSTSPNYRESLFGIVHYVLHATDCEEESAKPIVKLLDVVLLSCKGRVDEWLWPYLELVIEKLNPTGEPLIQNKGYATLLMNVVPAALVYNADATLKLLEAHRCTGPVFNMWFKMLQQDSKFFRRVYDKKLTCVGLAHLLALPDAALPPVVASSLPLILTELIRKLNAFKEQESLLLAQGSDKDEGDGNDSQEALDGDVEDLEVDPTDEDAQYLEMLAKTRNEKLQRPANDNDSADIDFDEWTDDEEVETPLDGTDPFQCLLVTMNTLQSSMPTRFQALVGSLDEGTKSSLQEVVQVAHIREANHQHQAKQAGSNNVGLL